MISLLCPTKRPDLCERMIESVLDTANAPVEILLAIDGDDFERYQKFANRDYIKMYFAPKNIGVSYLHNMLAEKASGDLLFVASDDVIFKTKGWDSALKEAYNNLESKIHVFCLQDTRDINGTPHPVITREFKDAIGYLFCPIFSHFYVDTWLSEIAKYNNCLTYLRDYILEHNKQNDIVAFSIRNNGKQERDNFINERCSHFLAVEKERLRTAINNKSPL